MGRRQRRSKAFAIGVLPAVATTAALAFGAGTAAANTTTQQFGYTDGNGVTHTCTINMTRTIPYRQDGQVGEGGTFMTGGAACTDGVIAYIGATYDDPDGESHSAVENSDGSSTVRRYAPVGSAFSTVHRVDFSGSALGCTANCDYSNTRTK